MKTFLIVWISFILICCSKDAKEGKSCSRLLALQKAALGCSHYKKLLKTLKVAQKYLFMPTYKAISISAIHNNITLLMLIK